MEIAFKQVKDYIYCPYKHYLLYQSGEKCAPLTVHEEFNQCVKKACYEFYDKFKAQVPVSEEDLRKTFGDNWYTFSRVSDIMFREEGINDKRRKLEVKAAQYINTFFRQQRQLPGNPLLVNFPYKIPILNTKYVLTGSIDLVRQRPDKGDIVELIVLKPTKYDANLFTLTHDIDFDEQTYAYRARFDIREHDGAMYYLEDGKLVYSKRLPAELQRFENTLIDVLESIDKKLYYPRYSSFCSTCQVKELCNRTVI